MLKYQNRITKKNPTEIRIKVEGLIWQISGQSIKLCGIVTKTFIQLNRLWHLVGNALSTINLWSSDLWKRPWKRDSINILVWRKLKIVVLGFTYLKHSVFQMWWHIIIITNILVFWRWKEKYQESILIFAYIARSLEIN